MKIDYLKLAKQLKEAKNYSEVLEIDVSSLIDKKGKVPYISWPHLQAIGKIAYGNEFNWKPLSVVNVDGEVLVEIQVSIKGDIQIIYQPVLDFTKGMPKGIKNPNSFQINNAQVRGFAKAFSMLTGLGLTLWIGEDSYENKQEAPQAPKVEVITNANGERMATAKQIKWAISLMESNQELVKIKGIPMPYEKEYFTWDNTQAIIKAFKGGE